MADKVYPKYKEALMQADANVDLEAEDVKAVLIDAADYTYDDAHDFLDDVPAGARVATSGNLAGKSVSALGVFDADDVTFTAASGDVSEAIILYIDTGVEGTSRLVAYLDGLTGLPVTPNGGDLNVQWHASGIFQL